MASIFRVTSTGSFGASGGSFTQLYFLPSVLTEAHAQECVDAVRDFWSTIAPGLVTSSFMSVSGVVDVVEETDGELVDTLVALPRVVAGTAAGDALPFQTQGLVKWGTATVADGRRISGRTFLPFAVEGDNALGVPLTGYVTRGQTAASALVASAVTALGVWRRPVRDAVGTVIRPGLIAAVTEGIMRDRWAVQRGRRA